MSKSIFLQFFYHLFIYLFIEIYRILIPMWHMMWNFSMYYGEISMSGYVQWGIILLPHYYTYHYCKFILHFNTEQTGSNCTHYIQSTWDKYIKCYKMMLNWEHRSFKLLSLWLAATLCSKIMGAIAKFVWLNWSTLKC